jgi:hypothetical protein
MFRPYSRRSTFGPALKALSLYVNAFDGYGNGWIEETDGYVTFRITLLSDEGEDNMRLDKLEQQMYDKYLSEALGVKSGPRRKTTETDTLDISVHRDRLLPFEKTLHFVRSQDDDTAPGISDAQD